MNKERRKKVANIVKDLEIVMNNLSDVLSDEEFAFDSMPENLQGSLRGAESEEAIDNMSEAIDSLQSAYEILENM